MTARRSFLAAAFGLCTALLGTSVLARPVTLSLHQFLPRTSTAPQFVLDEWIRRVEEDSDGRIKINHYPSMQLGGTPPELYDQAVDGVADIIWTVVGYTPGRFPRSEVFELPFFMEDVGAASYAFWKMSEAHMADTDFSEVKVLGTWVHGPGAFHSDRTIRLPEDLEGMKIRGGSRQVNALLEEAGADPIGMPAPALPEALSKGVLDGVTLPWEVTNSVKVTELVRHHTEFEGPALYTLTFIMVMNQDRYDSLPEDLQAVIDRNSGLEFSVFGGTRQAGGDAAEREKTLEMGNEFVMVSGDDLAVWQEAVKPVYANWVADMEAKGIDGQALIDEARALMADYPGPDAGQN